MRAPARQRHVAVLVRTLRENGRLLALLAQRCEADRLVPPAHGPTFRQPADVATYLGPEMADLPQEQLRVVLLDRRGRLIEAPLVYQGGQAETGVRLADCFREAVRRSAAAVILVHNHPSSDPSASPDDVRVTHAAGQAGLLLGIPVLDHVILARDAFVSLRAQGLHAPSDAPAPSPGSGSESERVPRCSADEARKRRWRLPRLSLPVRSPTPARLRSKRRAGRRPACGQTRSTRVVGSTRPASTSWPPPSPPTPRGVASSSRC